MVCSDNYSSGDNLSLGCDCCNCFGVETLRKAMGLNLIYLGQNVIYLGQQHIRTLELPTIDCKNQLFSIRSQ